MSPACKRLLETLLAMEKEPDGSYEAEVVCDGAACYVGVERFSRKTVNEAVRVCALENVSDEGGIDRFTLNEIGKGMLRRPELEREILDAIKSGRSVLVGDDRVKPMR
jgi:hypothetical protein